VKSSATVDELIEPYLRVRMRRREMVPLTARNARSSLRSYGAACGNRPVNQLGAKSIETWLEDRGDRAAATRRGDLSAVRAFVKWLAREGYVRRDFSVDVAPIKLARTLPRALPPDAVASVLSMCPDERMRVACLLMVQEGLRCVEVSRLQLGDINFMDNTIRVVGKGGHERLLPLSDETRREIDAYLALEPATSGPLVRSRRRGTRGEALTADTLSGMVSEIMRGAGVKRYSRDGVSAHALRHTMATDALRQGAHLRDVQAALGHAHLATTQTYLPLVVHDLREAMGGRRYR
jgi:integrase/recombinase XerD